MSLNPARCLSDRASSLPGNKLVCPKCAQVFQQETQRDMHYLQLHMLELREREEDNSDRTGLKTGFDRTELKTGSVLEAGRQYQEPQTFVKAQDKDEDNDGRKNWREHVLFDSPETLHCGMKWLNSDTVTLEEEREDRTQTQQQQGSSMSDEDAPVQLFREFCAQELKRIESHYDNIKSLSGQQNKFRQQHKFRQQNKSRQQDTSQQQDLTRQHKTSPQQTTSQQQNTLQQQETVQQQETAQQQETSQQQETFQRQETSQQQQTANNYGTFQGLSARVGKDGGRRRSCCKLCVVM